MTLLLLGTFATQTVLFCTIPTAVTNSNNTTHTDIHYFRPTRIQTRKNKQSTNIFITKYFPSNTPKSIDHSTDSHVHTRQKLDFPFASENVFL